jgi:hypothetical protein
VGQLAQLGDRGGDLGDRLVERPRRVAGPTGPPLVLDVPQAEADRHQPLLHPVLQVPLDALRSCSAVVTSRRRDWVTSPSLRRSNTRSQAISTADSPARTTAATADAHRPTVGRRRTDAVGA